MKNALSLPHCLTCPVAVIKYPGKSYLRKDGQKVQSIMSGNSSQWDLEAEAPVATMAEKRRTMLAHAQLTFSVMQSMT